MSLSSSSSKRGLSHKQKNKDFFDLAGRTNYSEMAPAKDRIQMYKRKKIERIGGEQREDSNSWINTASSSRLFNNPASS
jgi:hypothetical protein